MAVLMFFVQTFAVAVPLPIDRIPESVDASVFQLDEEALELAMLELNNIEDYLDVHEDFTYTDLELNANDLALNLSAVPAPAGSIYGPLGIPSFIWGFVLSVAGIVIVYIMTDGDKQETKKSLYGCVTSAVVIGVVSHLVSKSRK